jgi:hypothetical protein
VSEAHDRELGLVRDDLEIRRLPAPRDEVRGEVDVVLDQTSEPRGAEVLPRQPQLQRSPAARALEAERLGHDADGQRAELAGDARDDRRGAGARAAALAGRDEHHVRALDRVLQLVAALGRRGLPHLGVRPCTEAARRLCADVDLHVRVDDEERLGVRVRRDEVNAAEARVDHAVDRVRSAAADPDDLDHCQVIACLIAYAQRPSTSSSTVAHGFVSHRQRPRLSAIYGAVNASPA